MATRKKEKEEHTGGQLGDYPNDKYRVFFEKFPEIETLSVDEWKPVHILAYFCKRYKEQYDVNYTFKFNSPSPMKCFEVFQVKRMAMLLSSSPAILKNYIDWIYETKVIAAKRRLTSISFMTHEGVMAGYKNDVLLGGKKGPAVDRSTVLPEKYKSAFQEVGINVASYGDLAFLAQMEQSQELTTAFEKIDILGFDKSVLDRIV